MTSRSTGALPRPPSIPPDPAAPTISSRPMPARNTASNAAKRVAVADNAVTGTARNIGTAAKARRSDKSINAITLPPPLPPVAAESQVLIEPDYGKPQLHFDRPSVVPCLRDDTNADAPEPDSSSTSEADSKGSNTLPPMPTRPGRHVPCQASKPRKPRALPAPPVPNEVVMKPYVQEAPPHAPHLSNDKRADFFPWEGNHPEDSLTEVVIKQGYYDRTQVPREELSARTALLPIMRHKSGLRNMSSLFVNVLDQRTSNARLTAPSTFKPPPRVTLTDTKRETWLRDLSNPAIPLRRLSRTIPHGIRGKILLDQCMSKSIPASRAVWLAKCVGANEMRAFKRKGAGATFAVGGEAKWIKDWTVYVEQFIDSVIGTCGDDDWSNKISYAIRLSAHFFSEQLLDREHFLDWIVQSLESASLGTLPVWLLILQVYWDELVQNRRYGRRTTAGLLTQLNLVVESDEDGLLGPIIQRLSHTITILMILKPANFIGPQLWSRCRLTVLDTMDRHDPSAMGAFEQIGRRNRKLESPTSPNANAHSPRRRLVQLLDSCDDAIPLNELADICLTIVPEPLTIVHELFEWLSSPFRGGLARVYLAVRLIRRWRRIGIDTDESILSFLASTRHKGQSKDNIYLAISELVRSRQFAVGRYLQWLIARGALNDYERLSLDDPCDVGLLAQVPLYNLPSPFLNLRRTLLTRSGFPIDDEAEAIAEEKSDLFLHTGDPLTSPSFSSDVARHMAARHTRAVKCEVNRWVRHQVLEHVTEGDPVGPSNWKDLSAEPGISAMTLPQFFVVRDFFEQTQDFSFLADVLGMVSSSDNPILLAVVADTLNQHIETFAAIGASKDIFDKLVERYGVLKARKPIEKCLLLSLTHVGRRIAGAEDTTRRLHLEMQQDDRKAAVAAYSPVSDHTADMMQSADSDFHDEIERLLSSGTSMDKHTMARLFETVATRIESSWTDSVSYGIACSLLSARLRTFDPVSYDGLMAEWLARTLPLSRRPMLSQALLPLVVTGCLSIANAVAASVQFLESSETDKDHPMGAKIALETLQLVTQTGRAGSVAGVQEKHQFQLQQATFARDRPLDMLKVVRRAIHWVSLVDRTDAREELETLLSEDSLLSEIRCLIIRDMQNVSSHLVEPLLGEREWAVSKLKDIANRLLHADGGSDVSQTDADLQVAHAIQLADNYSLPFCRLKLQMIFSSNNVASSTSAETDHHGLVDAFLEAVDGTDGGKDHAWMDLLDGLDENNVHMISERAEIRLLNSYACPTSVACLDNVTSTRLAVNDPVAARYLSMIQLTSQRASKQASPKTIAALVEKLESYAHFLHKDAKPPQAPPVLFTLPTSNPSDASPPQNPVQLIMWTSILLHLLVIHHSDLQSSDPNRPPSGMTPPQLRSRIALSLCAILIHQHLEGNDDLQHLATDIATRLLDDLPQDLSVASSRILKLHVHNKRLNYLLGQPTDVPVKPAVAIPNPAVPLHLAQRGRTLPFNVRWWEMLAEPTPHVGANDTSLSLTMFGARKLVAEALGRC